MTSRADTHAFTLHVSAVEFYFCNCFDLLDDHKVCVVAGDEIMGRRQVEVRSSEDVLEVMASVRDNRTTRATKMNPSAKAAAAAAAAGGGKVAAGGAAAASHGGSSRSHCALQCTLRQVHRASREVRVSSFTCVVRALVAC